MDNGQLLKENYKKGNLDGLSSPRENKFLSNVDDTIENALSRGQFSVGQLCRELAMSRSQLYRKIFELTGKSILKYINSYRLLKAQEMIKLGEFTIREVAYKVGFEDNHYFSRAFKKHFGNCPSYYLP